MQHDFRTGACAGDGRYGGAERVAHQHEAAIEHAFVGSRAKQLALCIEAALGVGNNARHGRGQTVAEIVEAHASALDHVIERFAPQPASRTPDLLGAVAEHGGKTVGEAFAPIVEPLLRMAEQGCEVLAAARMITVINDREGEFFAHWALTPSDNVHLLTRAMHDHALAEGGTLYQAVERARFCDKAVIDLPQRMDRHGRQAHLSLRFGTVVLKRPARPGVKELPEGVEVSFVEVVELHPPKGDEPVHWLLLTTHSIANATDAWRIVSWYKQRWIIEQLFRSLKNQGLRIEDSQLESAEALIKLVAIATKAACIVIQLVQARNGGEQLSVKCAFTPEEIEALAAINKSMKGRTELQKNPHRPHTLQWAAWIIAKLGGWTGYASHRPPGPVTFHNGMARFQIIVAARAIENV